MALIKELMMMTVKSMLRGLESADTAMKRQHKPNTVMGGVWEELYPELQIILAISDTLLGDDIKKALKYDSEDKIPF